MIFFVRVNPFDLDDHALKVAKKNDFYEIVELIESQKKNCKSLPFKQQSIKQEEKEEKVEEKNEENNLNQEEIKKNQNKEEIEKNIEKKEMKNKIEEEDGFSQSTLGAIVFAGLGISILFGYYLGRSNLNN